MSGTSMNPKAYLVEFMVEGENTTDPHGDLDTVTILATNNGEASRKFWRYVRTKHPNTKIKIGGVYLTNLRLETVDVR